jgi:hypothetical protein
VEDLRHPAIEIFEIGLPDDDMFEGLPYDYFGTGWTDDDLSETGSPRDRFERGSPDVSSYNLWYTDE